MKRESPGKKRCPEAATVFGDFMKNGFLAEGCLAGCKSGLCLYAADAAGAGQFP
jgi:hypothetical protein